MASTEYRASSTKHRWPLNQDAYQAGGLTTCAKKRLPTDQAEKVANFQLLIAPGSLAPSYVAKYFSGVYFRNMSIDLSQQKHQKGHHSATAEFLIKFVF